MKNWIIKLSFSSFVFVFCLVLTELFFQLNTKFSWVSPKAVSYDFSGEDKLNIGDELPQELIQRINKYSNFKPANFEIEEELNKTKALKVHELSPISPLSFMLEKSPRREPLTEITESFYNPVLKKYIFEAKYKMTPERTRQVEGFKYNTKAKNIVLLGCSMVFGVGVNQGEDFASQLALHLPGYNTYNLGIPGAGISVMLDDIENPNSRSVNINKNGGVAVYTFIIDHLERTFCSLSCYSERKDWTLLENYYDFDSSGKLVNYGSHKTSKPIKYLIYNLLAKSQFLKFIGFERPKIYERRHIEKYARFIKEIEAYYKRYNLDFYVYLPLANDFNTPEAAQIFRESGLKTIFYKNQLPADIQQRMSIISDHHWNISGNDYFSSVVAYHLKKQGY